MNNMLPFTIFLCIVMIQRILELFLAKSNEHWLKKQGGLEFGSRHYRYMVIIHVLFFALFIIEKLLFNRTLSPVWPGVLFVFITAQAVRIWAIASLGRFWNTKIIVLPNAKVCKQGPYRYLRHPNYLVVAVEFAAIPLLFNAYLTACLFTVINVIVLAVRIPEEEKALRSLTAYEAAFQECHRFIPRFVK